MKKLASLLLVLALLLSGTALAEATNVFLDDIWPCVKEPIDVTIGFVGQQNGIYDTDSMWSMKYWNEMTGMNVNWQSIDKSIAAERVPIMMAAGEMPDALMSWYRFSYSMITKYGVVDQVLYPLNELLDYMPNFSALLDAKPELRRALTAADGNIYTLPNMSDGTPYFSLRFFINQNWLNALNLEMPRTLDDLYAVLCAFRDNDMDGDGDTTDEIPFSGAWDEGYSERAWILNAYGFCARSGNTAIQYSEDASSAKAVYIPYTPEYKEYLTYMNKLWSENLIDKDMFTLSDAQVNAKFLDVSVGMGGISAPITVSPDHADEFNAMIPLVASANRTPVYPDNGVVSHPGMFMISANCDEEKAAALANFGDSFFTKDMFGLYITGPTYTEKDMPENAYGQFFNKEFGSYFDAEKNAVAYKYPAEYSSAFLWKSTAMSQWAMPGYSCNGNNEWEEAFARKYPETSLGQYYAANDYKKVYATWEEQIIENQCAYAKKVLPGFYYTEADQERVDELVDILDAYVTSMEAQFITGAVSLDQYDEFVKTLEAYGAKEYTDILDQYWTAYQAD